MSVDTPVEETVKKIILKIVRRPESEFKVGATFKELKADSLDVVQILVAVEDAYHIEIPEEDLENVTNIKSFIKLVERLLAVTKRQ